jgi:hypothetical protein
VGKIPHVTKRIDSKGRKQPATKVRKPATKVAASLPPTALPTTISPATASPVLPALLAVPVLPPPVALPLDNSSLEPEACAAARKAVYVATELQPAEAINAAPGGQSANTKSEPTGTAGAAPMGHRRCRSHGAKRQHR